MNLLAAALYDPSTAVTNKATSALLAMTAFDTTNLRLTVTAPPSGRLWIVIICTIHGATTCPQIILGCLEGSTVRGRVTPEITVSNLAATSLYRARAEYCLVGLTPGQQYVLDAAYGVETVVASTNIKYGGPNNTTGNDNFGAFQFEIWDPSPAYTPSAGAAPTSTLHAKLDAIDDFIDTEIGALTTNLATANANIITIDDFLDTEIADIRNRLPAALVSGRMDCSVGAMASNVITAAAVNAAALNGKGDWNIGKTGYTLTAGPLDAAGTRSALGLASANLDTQLGAIDTVVDSILVDTAEIGAAGAGLTAITSKTDNLPSDPADASDIAGAFSTVGGAITTLSGLVESRLAADDYVAPDNAGIAAIKEKTDELTFTLGGALKVDMCYVNGVLLAGAGTGGDPMRPA